MAPVKIDDSLTYHPKLDELIKATGVSRAAATGHLVHLWLWCLKVTKDGCLPRVSDAEIASYSLYFGGDPKLFVDALVDAGFLDRMPGVLKVHDWDQWLPREVEDKIRHERRSSSRKVRENSAENSGSEQESLSSSVVVLLSFPVVGTTREWLLTEEKLREYRETYTGIDALSEAKKALQWIRDNPTKKKTFTGMPRFMNSWFSRAQNSYRPNGFGSNGYAKPGAVLPAPGKYDKFRVPHESEV